MKVSTRAHYGLRAMVTIAQMEKSGIVPVSVMDIAQREELSDTYLEQLVSKLRRAGLLRSYRGANGGYELAKDPSEITILEIVQASGEKLEFPECAFNEKGCELARQRGSVCPSAFFWRKLSSAVLELSRSMTLEDLLSQSSKSLML
ncbi:rrf2 family protein, putative transcriptional regulator [Jonquetella anthropi DSM 22815]|uniref:Rrf2 family protein, putative transcriptional regulator n=1 Tax=Jonquetella anthropi DSM 22815 TaxID=885272 RepID=H0UJM1_9BACT|nr:Rrf2 family transcriptional regulator [Jonquetella anthropi]EHM12889.1 rrf2 family protein, putative transcriptional regulator [Jonquetella anthropi DSM 22815]